MLRYRALFHFMLEHHPQLANQIRQAYTNTMKWYYSHHFDRFKKTLEKVKLENRLDFLGNDESSRSSLFSSGKKSILVHDAFQLGDRIDILKSDELISIQPKDLEKPV
jgi:vacuolar protein sorting-associated protein 52